jgi:MFS family permease
VALSATVSFDGNTYRSFLISSLSVLGLIIGAIFVEFANWSWVFWFVAMVAIPIGLLCTFLVPNTVRSADIYEPGKARWKSLDLGGVSILTGTFILRSSPLIQCSSGLCSGTDFVHLCGDFWRLFHWVGIGNCHCTPYRLCWDGCRLLLL